MYVNRFILLSFLCVHICLSPRLYGSASRGPLSPAAATRAMLQLMPNERGFLTKLKSLVKAGADVNAKNKRGMSVLHRVAFFGSPAAAQFIVDNAGDMSLLGTFSQTPLFLAIYSDNDEVARVLMGKDVDPNFLDSNNMTPLLYALEHDSPRVAKILITRGASLDVTNKKGQTPLHLVKDKGLAQLILAKGGDPDAQDKMGMTPLHYAADFDNRPVAKLLVSASKDVNIQGGNDKLTPLHYVRSAELAELILKNGGDPNVRASNGQTSLHWVKHQAVARVVVMYGGDLNAEDVYGRTPMDYTSTKELVHALVLLGADPEKSYAWRQKENKKNSNKEAQTKGNKNKDAAEHPTKSMYNNQRNSTKAQGQPDFLTNLNAPAGDKTRNPIIGRQQELAQVTNALRRKGMRGTVLVGDAGVGKTALVEGLAYMLANDELPELAGREIYALDVGSMWGHPENKYVGQLHSRVNDALKFIAADPDKRILFIDEIHQLLGGGFVSNMGSPPITDILKPYLGRGDIQLIGTTTHDEYQRIIAGDRAIVDRLLRIDIDEPSAEETLTILHGIKTDYEQHYGIAIADTALQAAVNLSHRYLASQQQPRKAITLLDEASSAIPHDAQRLTKKHLATIVAEKIGIPAATILKSKNKKIAELLPALQKQIYGQDHALQEVNSSLAIAFADLADETQPMAAFMFGGPTGVGKTETAKEMARHLFDSEDNFIFADMSGYKHPTSVIALTERLTRAVKAKPHAVILLDEIEKAHPEVQHLLLQLLDEGRLTDSHQRQVDFTNTIIVLTTNSKRIYRDFAPELLNRLDKIITYRKLSPNVSMRLVQKQLDALNLNRGLRDKKITVSLSAAAIKIIADAGYSQEFGARAMARVFDQLVKYPLADGINSGVVTSGQDYRIDLQHTGKKQIEVSIILNDEVVLEVSVKAQGDALQDERDMYYRREKIL